MTSAEEYRALAMRFRAHARSSDHARLASEWEHLARCYSRLAEQAERNSTLDLVYETPPQQKRDTQENS